MERYNNNMNFTESEQELLDFYRLSYGKAYNTDQYFYDEYMGDKATDYIINRDENNNIINGAIFSQDRIIAIGTNVELQNRMEALKSLMIDCKEKHQDSYITIGVQYEAVKYACRCADMSRVYDIEEIQKMLQNTINDNEYQVLINQYGTIISRPNRPNYHQEIYR